MFDPRIGRFVSADPFVQAPFNSQSYNRYAYVFNNPQSAVDPSGFWFVYSGPTRDEISPFDVGVRAPWAGWDRGPNFPILVLVPLRIYGGVIVAGSAGVLVVGGSIIGAPVVGAVVGGAAVAVIIYQGYETYKKYGTSNGYPGVETIPQGVFNQGTSSDENDQSKDSGEASATAANAPPEGDDDKNKTETTQGKGRAPKDGTPNSIYEQVDDKGNVRSRTFYDQNGRSFSRQDFDHEHDGMRPHEQQRRFDASGRPITSEKVVRPKGYN